MPHRTRTRREPAAAPTKLASRSWWDAIKRTFAEFKKDELTDRAAALTYYGVLSLFPAMLVVVSLVGLAGRQAAQSLSTNVAAMAPGSLRQVLTGMLTELQQGRGAAGLAAVLGLAAAVWSASGYVGAFMRASNVVYDVGEGRPVWKTLPTRVAVTLVTLVLLAVSAVLVVITGPLAAKAGALIGAGPAAVTVWNVAKWPVLFLVAALLFSLLYWASPNARRGVRWVVPGVVLALVVWLVASAAFGLYVANFSSYNKTYGSFAGVIIFLVWLWLSNTAILLGAELNAELERGRAMSAGRAEEAEPYVEPRDDRKLDDDATP